MPNNHMEVNNSNQRVKQSPKMIILFLASTVFLSLEIITFAILYALDVLVGGYGTVREYFSLSDFFHPNLIIIQVVVFFIFIILKIFRYKNVKALNIIIQLYVVLNVIWILWMIFEYLKLVI